jgi:uncharacterized protein (TIGR03437 family)
VLFGGIMQGRFLRSIGCGVVVASLNLCLAANFGTVVPVHGTVSDIALDERHGRVYAANFSAYRVEVVNTATNALLSPFSVPMPPSAVAVSPDNRFLVVGEYQAPDPAELAANPFAPESGGYTIFDLDANQRVDVNLGRPVLAIAFGADGRALIVVRSDPPATGENPPPPGPNLFLLDPALGSLQPIAGITISSRDLSVPLATFPTQIIQAAVSVSGDRNTIVVQAAPVSDNSGAGALSIVIRYHVDTQTATEILFGSSPPPGPKSVSVDQTAANVLVDWGLLHYPTEDDPYALAQFPAADGAFNIGTHAWDVSRNLIYAQIPAPGDAAVLHIVDTDNLTVRERIQLQENLAGKSVMSSDSSVMYSASVSGVTILPIAQLPQIPQVGTTQEDLLFTSDACANLGLQQVLNITSLSSVQTDFTLSLPTGTTGVSFSKTSGTTPARIVVTIDPTAFQGVAGTTSIPLTITSTGAVNLPPPVRLLINTRDFNQRGQIVDVPGKLVDMLADPVRNRLYVLRQDKNLVLVYETVATPRLIATLRTGNTPMHMAMTTDGSYMIVGNDNSQIANVFDLEGLTSTAPIIFPFGHYPRTIGVASNAIFATIRAAGGPPAGQTATPPSLLDHIDFANRIADTPATLSAGPDRAIYENNLPTADGVLAATPGNGYLLLALTDGNVLEYDASAQTWVASRKDLSAPNGAYGAFSGNLFLVGPNLLDAALVPIGQPFDDSGAATAGTALLNGAGLRTTSSGAANPGLIQRIDLTNLNAYNGTAMAEAPATKNTMLTPAVGQIGESILSFTRGLAVSADQSKIFALTVSGLTMLPPNFDAVLAKPVISSVVNSADGSTAIAVGGDININGVNLAPAAASAGAPPLPTSLGDVCAVLGDTPLPLFSVSSPLLVAQLPFSITSTSTLVIHTPGGISDPFPVTVLSQAPAIFSATRDDNNELLNFTNPIHPNTEITIYLTGLGLTAPLPALGDIPPSGQVAQVVAPPTVKLGSVNMFVISASLTPDQVGVYQIKAKAPGKVQPGKSVQLTVEAGGVSAGFQVRVVSP